MMDSDTNAVLSILKTSYSQLRRARAAPIVVAKSLCRSYAATT